MGIELEYKFAATAQALEKIAGDFAGLRKIEMRTVYYDTADRSLAQKRCTLRLRQENDISVCTLKTPLPDGSRAEWECEAPSIQEGITQIPEAAALVQAPLAEVCGARFIRLAALVPTADGTAELALDKGVLLGGGQEIPLCEVEIEYKSGSYDATLALAQEIAARYGLTPEQKSKFARACALAEGEHHG